MINILSQDFCYSGAALHFYYVSGKCIIAKIVLFSKYSMVTALFEMANNLW